MMMKRQKIDTGWTEYGIMGMVFLPIGILFLVIGLILPLAVRIEGSRVAFLATFGLEGLVFTVLGAIFLGKDLARRRGQQRAYDEGYCVTGQIAGIFEKRNVRRGRRYPLVLECHYTDPDTGEMHVCYSRHLDYDPMDMLTSRDVPIYLDRMNGKYHFVDIDAVLPKVHIHNE